MLCGCYQEQENGEVLDGWQVWSNDGNEDVLGEWVKALDLPVSAPYGGIILCCLALRPGPWCRVRRERLMNTEVKRSVPLTTAARRVMVLLWRGVSVLMKTRSPLCRCS